MSDKDEKYVRKVMLEDHPINCDLDLSKFPNSCLTQCNASSVTATTSTYCMRSQQAKRLLVVVAYRQRWIKSMKWGLLVDRSNVGTINEKVKLQMLDFAQDGREKRCHGSSWFSSHGRTFAAWLQWHKEYQEGRLMCRIHPSRRINIRARCDWKGE